MVENSYMIVHNIIYSKVDFFIIYGYYFRDSVK